MRKAERERLRRDRALAAGLELWTLDRDLQSAAAELGAEFLLP